MTDGRTVQSRICSPSSFPGSLFQSNSDGNFSGAGSIDVETFCRGGGAWLSRFHVFPGGLSFTCTLVKNSNSERNC